MYQLLLFFFICAEISLQGQSKFSKNYKRTDVQGDVLHVNNVKALVSNNGWLFWGGGPGGFIIPSPVFSENPGQFGTMFASGIAIAGKVDGAIRTSQVKYGSDFSPGSWDQYQADTLSINSPDWKIYYYYSTEHIDYLQELLENDQKKIRDFAQSELDRALVANTEWQTKAVGQGAPELPLGDVAVFYICHDSNVKRRSSNRGLEPLNVQVRVLQWAYKSTDAINNTIFTKVEFINKNSVPINDAIISLWADMDLGDYSDDLLGSDPQLDLAYIYNSDDYDNQYTRILGLRPPAMGYDLLQGPVIDSAGHQLDVLNSIHHIYRNSKTNQTAEMQITDKYVVAAAGVNYVLKGDDGINPIELYNTMIGLTPEGERHPFQLAAVADGLTSEMDSHFFFNGEPEQLSGWLNNDSSDKRFLLNSPRFDLAVSDGSETFGDPGYNSIVFAAYASFGSSNLASVTQLKEDNIIIDQLFNFGLIKIPEIPAPEVNVIEYPDKIVINWQSSEGNYIDANGKTVNHSTETYNFGEYKFQGYELRAIINDYQTKYLVTFDRIDSIKTVYQTFSVNGFDEYRPAVYAQNTGISHSFVIDSNFFDYERLKSGQYISLALRAYAVNLNSTNKYRIVGFSNPAEVLDQLKLNLDTVKIYDKQFGDFLAIEHSGNSNGTVEAKIVNPALLKERTYEIRFDTLKNPNISHGIEQHTGELVWQLYENGQLVEFDLPLASPQTIDDFARVVQRNGIEFKVMNPGEGFKNFLVTANANGPLDPPDYAAFAFNSSDFPHPTTSDRPDPFRQQVNGSTWGIHTQFSDNPYVAFHYQVYVNRSVLEQNGWKNLSGNDFELRFTDQINYAYDRFSSGELLEIPFEVWNVTRNVRLIVAVFDVNGGLMFNFDGLDHNISGGDNDPQTDAFYWFLPNDMTEGDAGYQQWLASSDHTDHGEEVIGRQVLVNWNGGLVTDSLFPANVDALMPETGTIIRYETNKPISPNDIFLINSSDGTAKISQQTFILKQNYPNPFNPSTAIRYDLTFSNHVRLDVFNVLGQRVKTLVNSYQQAKNGIEVIWDGTNNFDQQLPAGIYFYRLQTGDRIETKKMVMIK